MMKCSIRLFVLGVVFALPTLLFAQSTSPAGQKVICANGDAAGFSCSSVDLAGHVDSGEMGGRTSLNDIWGWTDPDTGKEYALVGRRDGTAFVDVSDPINPVYVGILPGHSAPSTWRDIKVYQNHAYVVSEANNHGMQVFDLTQLRDISGSPVTFEATLHYDKFASAHNIAINEDTGYAYVIGANSGGTVCGGGLHMINIQVPTQPTFVGCFADDTTGRRGTGYSHDVQCVNYHGPDQDYQGREICIGSNETHISVADVTEKAQPKAVSTATYPTASYIHQGWLTEDHRYFFQNDELDTSVSAKSRTFIWDLEDLDDPILVETYTATVESIDHNLYVVGNLVFQANYTSGLRILDISDVTSPKEVGYFDTSPSTQLNYGGAWSVYPFFESGTVVVSSVGEGLFILQPHGGLFRVDVETEELPDDFVLSAAYPNPFNPQTNFTVTLPAQQDVTLAVFDVLGREVDRLHEGILPSGTHTFTFNAATLTSGTYLIRAIGARSLQTQMVTLLK